MTISFRTIVFDAADLDTMSSFWAGMLGGSVVHKDDDWHTIMTEGQPRMAIQLAPDHVPPQWPDGAPQQMHLDLTVDDLAAGHEKVIKLGGRLLQAAPDPEAPDGFQVYADPAGHPFCLCWG
jgi:catechol-2,3-dioxygenase